MVNMFFMCFTEAFTLMSSVANSLSQARGAATRTKEASEKTNKVKRLDECLHYTYSLRGTAFHELVKKK